MQGGSNPQQPLALSPEHLQKTLAIKNSHISQLLEQLKKTQQLHGSLKKKYLADEQKLKQRMAQLQRLSDELHNQNCELIKKYRALEAASQGNQAKFNKLGMEWEKEMQGFRMMIERLKVQNMKVRAQKNEVETKLKSQLLQKQKSHQKIKEQAEKIASLETEVQGLKVKISQKQEEWEKWNNEVKESLKEMEYRSTERKKMTLNELENKVRGILIDL